MKRVLVLVMDGLEEIETLAPVDLLRRAGVEVTMASVAGPIHVTGRNGVTLHADAALDAVAPGMFDLLIIPGGPGVKFLREDGRAAKYAQFFAEQGKPVAAICAAPTVLHDAGLLVGRRYTSHAGVRDEITESVVDEKVIIDGGIITSQGAGTAIEFGLALVELLCGEDVLHEVKQGIMW
jgi:protein deglycase